MTGRTIKRYSESFKIQVVKEYEAGSDIPELRKKYGIAGPVTITNWINKYSKEGLRHKLIRIQTAEEANRIKELEAEALRTQTVEETNWIKELEAEAKALKDALVKVSLEKLALENTLNKLQETGVVTEEAGQ